MPSQTDKNNTAKFIKDARTLLGLKQYELAKKLRTSRVNVCKYETGTVMPPAWVVLKLFKFLKKEGITISV